MKLDAIIIASASQNSFSGTSIFRLDIDGHVADLQTVMHFIKNNGRIKPPIQGQGQSSWAAAPKLNGIYLFSYLNAQGLNVATIDSFYDQQEMFKQLVLEKPSAIVISTTFITNLSSLNRLVEDVRSIVKETKVIVGGPFVYMSYLIYERSQETGYLPDTAKSDFLFLSSEQVPGADLFVISAGGEKILYQAIQQLKKHGEFGYLPNTAILADCVWSFSEMGSTTSKSKHIIQWDALPDDIFHARVVPLEASCGCPYNCAFCNFVKDRRAATVKPIDYLINEMKQVRNRGAKYVWFTDDNFRLGKKDLETVCRLIIKEDLELQWMTFIRADVLDTIDPNLLSRAGCIEVQLGIESADHQVLRNMNKHVMPELYERVLNKLLANGINCSCYLIFGFPGETDQSARRTIEFMRRQESRGHPGLLTWSIFPFVLAPLSPVYEETSRKVYGLSGYMKHWRHATMDSERAMEYVIQAFLGIEHSGLIYRSDNQDMMKYLDPYLRKLFQSTRHSLSKMTLQSKITKEEILSAFKNNIFWSKEQSNSYLLHSDLFEVIDSNKYNRLF